MPVELKESEQIVIPERKEQRGTRLWPTLIHIELPDPAQEGRVILNYLPRTESGEVIRQDNDGNPTLRAAHLNNLFASIPECPEFAVAFGAIENAVRPLLDLIEKREAAYQAEQLQKRAPKVQYFDDAGTEVFQVLVCCVCPVAYSADAGSFLLQFLHEVEQDDGATREGLFGLGVGVGGNVTHVVHQRLTFTHHVARQIADMASMHLEWVGGRMFTLDDAAEMPSKFFATLAAADDVVSAMNLDVIA